MQAPSGNVTFLFTDIEHSTQLWEKHPTAMGLALAQHDRLVRAAIIESEGYVFKTVGDAFCAAFGSGLHAVRAAVAAQRALAMASWGETGPLRVRMALHSGEAEERDHDYFGPTVNRVARLLAVGHGGQVLLSWVTAEIVREQMPPEWSFWDLGERRLKDLSRGERIFQLVIPELPTDFPPLRTAASFPNNLPAQVTSFIGRAKELTEVKRLLQSTRLLTLTGAGGTGKTRLSLEAAAELLDQFPNGVWLVELATVSDAAQVPETIAEVVEVREEHGRPLLETLVESLRTRRLLLLLDNCEHLVTACARTAAALLRRCPNLKILATSREALNVGGETVQPVLPLAAPEFGRFDDNLPLERLARLDAVQLFVERAAALRPGFALTRENASLIGRICWRLDGIPLAIELAAARVKVLSLEQILARLDQRFRLLSGGLRTASPRQQTLSALIDWSYELLSESERMLLRRLTVFVAGRTLEMAEEVCSGHGLDRAEIFDLLSALVEKSLLMIETGVDGESRYTMLESVWDYGDDRLTEHHETAVFRRKHLEYFVRVTEEAEPALFGAGQKAWLERLAGEHPNLNMALRFSAERDETVELGLRLAGAVGRFWEVRSYLSEGYEHLQKLLARAEHIELSVRAKAELGAGRLSWSQDRDADALRHYHTAQALYESLGRFEQVGVIHAMIGFSERNDGRPEAARTHFEQARSIGETHGSDRVVAMAESGLGSLAADEGDFAKARVAKERALACFRGLGDHWAASLVTGSLGRVCYAAGDLVTARRLIAESLTSAYDLGNKWAAPYLLEALADISAQEGSSPEDAVRLYGSAAAQREALALNFSTTEKAMYDRGLSRLRQLISAEAFEPLWTEGRGLSLPAAIELAMGADRASKSLGLDIARV